MTADDLYTGGEYLKNNPSWDVEDAPWKAGLIHAMMQKHHLAPATVCEIGCGCGEILVQLQKKLPPSTRLTGFEISPQAFELCRHRSNEGLIFRLEDYCTAIDNTCDLILLIDVIEHLEDYACFLRTIRNKSPYVLLHIPLEMFVLAVLHPQFHLGQRKKVGHLHTFSREIALEILRDAGFEIIDYHYTAGYTLPRDYGLRDKFLKIPRALFYPLVPDFTVRVFGGYSLLVLVRS